MNYASRFNEQLVINKLLTDTNDRLLESLDNKSNQYEDIIKIIEEKDRMITDKENTISEQEKSLNKMNNKYNELKFKTDELLDNKELINTKYQQLLTTYNSLNTSYDKLKISYENAINKIKKYKLTYQEIKSDDINKVSKTEVVNNE